MSVRALLLAGSQASPVCPCGNSKVSMAIGNERWRNNTDSGKTEVLIGKPASVPLRSPQVPHAEDEDRSRDSAD